MNILLYYSKTNKIIEIKDNIIDELYYNLAVIPTIEQIQKYKNTKKNNAIKLIDEYKNYISSLIYKLPLFDYDTKNIVLINNEDIYQKVVVNYYRFPDNKLLNLLKNTITKLNNIDIKRNWIIKYINKLNKNLNFLNNYNLDILKETYLNVFINTNPNSRELTNCIKPSYLPYQKYQSPYYSKSELISMGLNLGIVDKNLNPWSYSESELNNICDKLYKYEINTKMLIYNQLYILYNNAKSYIQFYSLFGSYYINNYLRNKNSVKDIELENHINNIFQLMKHSPNIDSNYEVYRFIDNDDYISSLKKNEIFIEDSFISTTRDPFYSSKQNVFGFILIKIKLPINISGISLLIESYSNYPHEQEILITPGKLKLIEINSDFKYYHWNKLEESKITKKYIFEYIEPLSYDIDFYTKKYIKNKNIIPEIDFYKINYEGLTTNEKTLNFFNSLLKINLRRTFYSKIGNIKYQFYAYYLIQSKIYSKYFFLQKEDSNNKLLGDEIYLTIQNPENGNIELIIEIRNIISINYYFRYAGLSNNLNHNDLLHFLAGLAKSLVINTIIIHGNYSSYVNIVENIINSTNPDNKEENLFENFSTIQNIDNPDMGILNLYTADINTYCVDLTDYIFQNKKYYFNYDYIDRKIPYHMIDILKNIKFIDIYNKYKNNINNIESIYKIYNKEDKNISLFELYKIIHLNFPYLIHKYQNFIYLSYPKKTIYPWHFYYVFKPYDYLFNNNIIKYIPNNYIDSLETLMKNLEDEVKFIHENKFRSIYL